MADGSAIEWTEATWNPITGCDRVSAGCDHCYALTLAKRLKAMGQPSTRTTATRAPPARGSALTAASRRPATSLGWRRPRVVFVNSMSDLFHARVPLEFIREVFDVMRRHPAAHLPGAHEALASGSADSADELDWPPNVWMGVSVEDRTAFRRIDHLRDDPRRRPVPVVRAAARPAGRDRSRRHRLGDRRRRVRTHAPTDGPRLGPRHPRRLPRRRSAVLLQAVGRPHTRRHTADSSTGSTGTRCPTGTRVDDQGSQPTARRRIGPICRDSDEPGATLTPS